MTSPAQSTEVAQSAPLSPLLSHIRDVIVTGLRKEYPYMEINAVHEAALASTGLLEQKIEDHRPIMQQSKKRSSFLSLFPELRNRIYELTLRPQTDGEGGIDGSRAIYIGSDRLVWDQLSYLNREGECTGIGYRITNWRDQPALTKLNRQIRSETLPAYYSNHFVIEVGNITLDQTREGRINRAYLRRAPRAPNQVGPLQWLQRMGPMNIDLIKHLDVIMHHNISHANAPSIEELRKYFLARETTLPATAIFLANCEAHFKGMKYNIWYPLKLPPPETLLDVAPQTTNGESPTLAYTPVDLGRALFILSSR